MEIKTKHKIQCEEMTTNQYRTSDNKVFMRKDEAESHETYLEWKEEVAKFGIKHMEDAYFCKTEEELDAVEYMLAYKNSSFRYPEQKFMPNFQYGNVVFTGPDWYFFHHETNMNYPDEYWVETMSQKKKEFNDWVKKFKDAEI